MKSKVLLPLLVLLFLAVATVEAQNKVQVDSKQASELLKKDKKIIVLDVRTAEEFNEGHIKGAVNIDIRQPDAYSKIDKLNHAEKYIVHCRTNHRSGMATDYMMQKGFKNVYQMMDGFPGWAANNLPWVK
jgi:Rhodanese-related sulfurtransferase